MKKIIVIVNVRNEGDIIESFLRYNLTYSDGILVYEGGRSFDNTRVIIQKLIDEGLSVYLEDCVYDPEQLITIDNYMELKYALTQRAFESFAADIVVSLDADEFPYHIEGKNPRVAFESMACDVEYRMPWRSYVYQEEPESYRTFLPSHFTHYRNPLFEKPYKALMSKKLYKEKQAKWAFGSHHLIFPGNRQRVVEVKTSENLVYAHFPIRSKTQFITKIILNRIQKWKVQTYREKEQSYHQKKIFHDLVSNYNITQEMMFRHSMEYSVHEEHFKKSKEAVGEQTLIEGRMNISFCAGALELRYTEKYCDNNAFMSTLLGEFNATASHLFEVRCKLEEHNHVLTHQNGIQAQRNNQLVRVNEELRKRINEMEQQSQQLMLLNKELEQQSQQLMLLNKELEQSNSILVHRNRKLEQNKKDLEESKRVLQQHCDEQELCLEKQMKTNEELGICNKQLEGVNIDLKQSNKELQRQIEEIYGSRTWKMGSAIGKVYRFFIPNKSERLQ